MKRVQVASFLAAVVVAACVDGGRPSGPSFAISDATHGDAAGRNKFFYWLPPLVPAPNATGDFNRFASPVVTVCQLKIDGTACQLEGGHPIIVAEFSLTSGTDGQLISVTGQDYHVNWHTDISHLNPDKVYRIGVAVEGRDYGFADVEVGLNAKELKNVNRNEFVPLVDGRTLPIKFRIEAGANCAGRESECAEAIVDPTTQETVILENDADVRLAFGDFPAGWTNGPQVVRIERIPDGDFGPGEGPLGTPFPQYPLFFHYFTSAPEPFNLPVRIGVCNVQDDPEEDDFHPQHRGTTVLAMGGEGDFRTLPYAPVADVLGATCFGAERQGSEIGSLPHGLDDVAGRVGLFAASLLAPRTLHASVLVLDGGMGGSTDFFSPAGTVDTARAAGLLLRYSFDGNANNAGTLPGHDGTATSVTYPEGRFGSAIKFDGTASTGATLTGTAAVFATAFKWTISLWYKEDAPPKSESLLWSFRGSSPGAGSRNRGWHTYHGVGVPGASVLTTCSDGGCFSFSTPATGAWHNIIYRYDGVSASVGAPVEIFVDGALEGSLANGSAIPLTAAGVTDFRLGNFTGVEGPSLFYLDEFRVYNQVFTVAQQCTDIIGGTWTGESCTMP